MSDTMTYLTDATMITAVVPAGRADDLLKAARDVGARGGIVHQARGTGARELLGLLGIAVEAEREGCATCAEIAVKMVAMSKTQRGKLCVSYKISVTY